MQLKFNDRKTLNISGKTVDGFNLTFDLTHTTANTAFSGTILTLQNAQVNITLERFGKKYPLVADNLANLAVVAAYDNSLWPYAFGAGWQILTAAAAGVKEEVLLPIKIALGGPITLMGGDKISAEIFVPASMAASTVDTTVSVMEFDENLCGGIELYTPYIKSYPIDASASAFSQGFNPNLLDVTFVNLDKTSALLSAQVVTNSNFSSNWGGMSDNYNILIQKRQAMLFYQGAVASGVVAQDRNQCFRIVPIMPGRLHQDAYLQLNLTSTNVAASKNFVVVRTAYTDQRLLEQYEANQKMFFETLSKNSQ